MIKPRVTELLLVTAVPTMLVAQRGLPSFPVLLVTLTGITCAAGSANTLGWFLCRNRGSGHRRPSRIPSPGRDMRPAIPPGMALTFGIGLAVAATGLLGLLVNWLSAVLADAAILLLVSADALARTRGPQYRVLAGVAACCFPVLAGWSAVTGALSLRAIVLAVMISCWAPPRLWALALESRADRDAGQGVTPAAAASAAGNARSILWYSCIVVAASFGLAPYGGLIYTVCALTLGGWFLTEAHRVLARTGHASEGVPIPVGTGAVRPMGLPGLSLACLAQLLAVVLAVVLLPRGR